MVSLYMNNSIIVAYNEEKEITVYNEQNNESLETTLMVGDNMKFNMFILRNIIETPLDNISDTSRYLIKAIKALVDYHNQDENNRDYEFVSTAVSNYFNTLTKNHPHYNR